MFEFNQEFDETLGVHVLSVTVRVVNVPVNIVVPVCLVNIGDPLVASMNECSI